MATKATGTWNPGQQPWPAKTRITWQASTGQMHSTKASMWVKPSGVMAYRICKTTIKMQRNLTGKNLASIHHLTIQGAAQDVNIYNRDTPSGNEAKNNHFINNHGTHMSKTHHQVTRICLWQCNLSNRQPDQTHDQYTSSMRKKRGKPWDTSYTL